MPHQRFKSENYENLGGMNTKLSQYLTGPRNALSLYNNDFSVPGAWTKRPGSTMYIGQTFAAPIQSACEYTKLSGASYTVLSTSNAIWTGTSPLAGWSFTQSGGLANVIGQTTYGATNGFWHFIPKAPYYYDGLYSVNAGVAFYPKQIRGWSFKVLDQVQDTYYSNYPYGMVYALNLKVNNIQTTDNNFDNVIFQDNLFISTSDKWLRFNGETLTFVGIPPVGCIGTSCLGSGTSGPVTGYAYQFYARLTNNRGFHGPLNFIGGHDMTGINGTTMAHLNGAANPGWLYQLVTPPQYGISSIDIYMYATSLSPAGGGFSGQFLNYTDLRFVTTIAASGTYITEWTLQYINGSDFYNNLTKTADGDANESYFFGTTLGVYTNGTTQWLGTWQTNITAMSPTILEEHANRIFFTGVSGLLSTVYFTKLSEPEALDDISDNFEVRTNDGDTLRCLKSYQNRLMCLKEFSSHELTGDSLENFSLRKITSEFGCVNNKSATVWKNKLWFLDRKGIIEYNGAQVEVVSTAIEPFFNSVNWSVAKTEACMVHNKTRNEIMTAVPINGATLNNAIAVYDYISDAWNIWTGPAPSVLSIMRRGFGVDTVFYGDYSGRLNYFSASLMGDNGSGITHLMQLRYEHPEGQSVEKQFRRAFINADSLTSSATYTISVKAYKNYSGATAVVSQTVYQNEFQKYVNFGVSAKSLSLEISHYSATDALRVYGYTLEYRYQRGT